MEIIKRYRILTKLFPSDLAIIINEYITYIVEPHTIKQCDDMIELCENTKKLLKCELYTHKLQQHLLQNIEYPELQKLIQNVKVIGYTHETYDDRERVTSCIQLHDVFFRNNYICYVSTTHNTIYYECKNNKYDFNEEFYQNGVTLGILYEIWNLRDASMNEFADFVDGIVGYDTREVLMYQDEFR